MTAREIFERAFPAVAALQLRLAPPLRHRSVGGHELVPLASGAGLECACGYRLLQEAGGYWRPEIAGRRPTKREADACTVEAVRRGLAT